MDSQTQISGGCGRVCCGLAVDLNLWFNRFFTRWAAVGIPSHPTGQKSAEKAVFRHKKGPSGAFWHLEGAWFGWLQGAEAGRKCPNWDYVGPELAGFLSWLALEAVCRGWLRLAQACFGASSCFR